MSLKLVAIPIGHPGDITLRSIEALKTADLVIGEEYREVSKLLKGLGITGKEMKLLNEHSDADTIRELVEDCRSKNVALVSDAGTPAFCDPGAQLVAACRKEKIPVSPLPGASSLMCILSVAGLQLREFVFRGFLPAEREARGEALRELDREARPVVLMDTPYRLAKLMTELAERWPRRIAVLGIDFTLETERILEGPVAELAEQVQAQKAEFILILHPLPEGSGSAKRPIPDRRHSPPPSKRSHRPRR